MERDQALRYSQLKIARAITSEKLIADRKHKRTHQNAREHNFNINTALYKPCSWCVHLEIAIHGQDGKPAVFLGCKEGNNPVKMYEDNIGKVTNGGEAMCPDLASMPVPDGDKSHLLYDSSKVSNQSPQTQEQEDEVPV